MGRICCIEMKYYPQSMETLILPFIKMYTGVEVFIQLFYLLFFYPNRDRIRKETGIIYVIIYFYNIGFSVWLVFLYNTEKPINYYKATQTVSTKSSYFPALFFLKEIFLKPCFPLILEAIIRCRRLTLVNLIEN